jgi:hypothetical protein
MSDQEKIAEINELTRLNTYLNPYLNPRLQPSIRSSKEGHMCPACLASTAVTVAAAGSTGGILAVCIGKFRKFFRANPLNLFQKIKEK